MRNDCRMRAVVLLGSVLAAAGCTTKQPESIGTRTASVRILAKADVNTFNCYEIWADDIDGIPADTGERECENELNSGGDPVVAIRNIPWRYSLTVSIIHAGSTGEEIATSLSGVIGSSVQPGDGIDNFISLTEYDPTDQPASKFRPPEFRPGYGIVTFENGRLVSRGSPIWLAIAGFGPGETNILTLSPTFDFEVNAGDTVIVRARKQLAVDAPPFLQSSPPPKIVLSGTLSVGGSLVTPAGAAKSTSADGAGISFSFTVQ